MSRRKSDPLRVISQEEQAELERISRERSASAEMVIRATLLLRVGQGMGYQAAAESVGRRDGDRVAGLVKRFNQEGRAALVPRHGGGPACSMVWSSENGFYGKSGGGQRVRRMVRSVGV